MKRIAIFQTDLNVGGIQKSLINLLNNIDYQKYKIDLYLFNNNNIFIKDVNDAVNVIYLKPLPFFTRGIFFNLLSLIYRPKINNNYDIAIDFNSYANETAIAAIKTKAKMKIMWIHNDVSIKINEEIKYRILHFFFKKKYKYFNKFIAVSTGALEGFKRVNKLTNKKYDVIPNYIDTEYIKAASQEKCNLAIDKNKINVCATGRLVHQKGYDLLFNKLYEIKEKLDNYHFYIIGDGIKGEELKKLVNDLELDNLITFLGNQENPYNIMKLMDAFVLNSRYEGQGMVFLEAYYLDLDIIMPDNLEKYVPGIKGSNDIKMSILKLKKRKHKYNSLLEYNDNIKTKINNL